MPISARLSVSKMVTLADNVLLTYSRVPSGETALNLGAFPAVNVANTDGSVVAKTGRANPNRSAIETRDVPSLIRAEIKTPTIPRFALIEDSIIKLSISLTQAYLVKQSWSAAAAAAGAVRKCARIPAGAQDRCYKPLRFPGTSPQRLLTFRALRATTGLFLL